MKKIAVMMLLGSLFVFNGVANAEEGKGPMEKFAAQKIDQLQTSCKTELETYCKNVTPGGGRIAACMYAYGDKLSTQCERALYNSAQDFEVAGLMLKAFADACQSDIKQSCSTVQVGEGRILKCLEENKATVSVKCNEARQQAKGGLEPKQVAA